MAKKKIGEIATAHDLNPKEVVKQLQEAGFSGQSPTSPIEENLAMKVLRLGENGAKQAEAPAAPPKERTVQPAGSQPRPQERRPPQRGGGGGGRQGGGGRPQQGAGRRGPQGGRPPQREGGPGPRRGQQ